MLRTHLVRRAGMLLGAAAASSVLSMGLLAATPASASVHSRTHLSANANGVSVSAANGVNNWSRHGFHHYSTNFDCANGV